MPVEFFSPVALPSELEKAVSERAKHRGMETSALLYEYLDFSMNAGLPGKLLEGDRNLTDLEKTSVIRNGEAFVYKDNSYTGYRVNIDECYVDPIEKYSHELHATPDMMLVEAVRYGLELDH